MRISPNAFLACTLLSILLTGCRQDTQETGNLLGGETSPYLLQHAGNPVHWQPWGEDLWDRAAAEGKLVLISIGYSSCHWCHVMEEETFEDDSVAAFMNEHFINVKVDREERPDVDQVYMTAVQLMTGSGGWPLNVVVLPNGKPIYGGTYHTRERWMQVLGEVHSRYVEDPQRLEDYADRVAEGVAEVNLIPPPADGTEISEAGYEAAIESWKGRWDPDWGGNAGTQKFMLPPNLNLLLSYGHLSGDQETLKHLRTTLDRMALGGIFDQIGGGFYRYSTDPRWHVPHFEKMLYDNAQLMSVYARAYQLFRLPQYREVVERTFEFLQRDLRAEGGGYYAALDADTDGEEGKYYLWEEAELKALLGDDYPLFAAYYSIHPDMAWEGGAYIPFRKGSDLEFSEKHGLTLRELSERIQHWQGRLLEHRSKRTFPRKDDKIITSWNALLISGLVDAYEAVGEAKYLQEAQNLFDLLLEQNYTSGLLRHTYKPGDSRFQGFLEDYAFLSQASFRLYQASGDTGYLERAEELLRYADTHFKDAGSPLYRYREEAALMSPIVKTDDGVMPSPNTVMATLFSDLGHFFYRPEYLDRNREMVQTLQERFLKAPENYAGWGRLLLRYRYPFYEVAVAGPEAMELRAQMAREFLPDALLVATPGESELPLYQARYDPEITRIFVCQDHSCRLPVTQVREALGQMRPQQALLP
jgi:uncharacterized protein YyaL (SSP411 family)